MKKVLKSCIFSYVCYEGVNDQNTNFKRSPEKFVKIMHVTENYHLLSFILTVFESFIQKIVKAQHRKWKSEIF